MVSPSCDTCGGTGWALSDPDRREYSPCECTLPPPAKRAFDILDNLDDGSPAFAAAIAAISTHPDLAVLEPQPVEDGE